jgi:predicted DNA-binding transcriptional regulator AlpA
MENQIIGILEGIIRPIVVNAVLDSLEGLGLNKRPAQTAPKEQEQIFNLPQLSKYLNQAESTTYANITSYPRRKVGKSWRFLKSEIDEWLKSQKVKSKAEIRQELKSEAENHLKSLSKK